MRFADNQGDLWSLELDYQTITRVRQELGLNLLNAIDSDKPFLSELANDEILLVDVISVCLTPQIESKGMDAEGFAKRLNGKVLEDAIGALVEGIANFSRPQKGEIIRKTWAKMKATEELGTEKVNRYLETQDFGGMIDEALAKGQRT
jgi:hypothetical protein